MKYFGIVLFLLLALLGTFSAKVFAQDGTVLITPTPTPYQQVNYEMPYPGLLPDNPFYILKTTRDQMVGLLITEPLKKSTFDLLQAEKRFQAGIMLYQKDPLKKALAFTTISKGQNYLEKAIEKASEASKQKVEVSGIRGKIVISIRKQQEVLKALSASHSEAAPAIEVALQRLDHLEKKANQMIPNNKPK